MVGREGGKISVVSNPVEFFCKTALHLGSFVPFLGTSLSDHFLPSLKQQVGLTKR